VTAINIKTAKAIGLTIPLLILAAVALAGNGVRAGALAAPAPGTATSAVTDATHLERVRACVYDVSCTRLLVAAHRMGFKGPFENTLWALNQNRGKTTDLLEFSVRETWDDRPIVIHDDTLDRTTNGSGRVRWHTLAQIRQLGIKGMETERIPTLEEVLDAARGRVFLIVSVKSASVLTVWKAIKSQSLTRQVILFLYKPRGHSRELNQLLAEGEDILFMPRLHKDESLDALIDLFYRPPQFVHIDQATLTHDALAGLARRKIRAYVQFPRGHTIAELRQIGRALLDKRVYFFLSDQALQVYEALPDAR
jgi:hypothetical protein